MFDFLIQATIEQATASIYYATRIIRHAKHLKGAKGVYRVEGLRSEPSPEEELLTNKIISEIERNENSSLEDLDDLKVIEYIRKLANILQTVLRNNLKYDEGRGQELLAELRKDKTYKFITGQYQGALNGLATEHENVRLDLSHVNLSKQDLSGVYLGGADLRYADLSGALFTRSDLRGADLRYANLSGAYLGGAYLGDADFTNVILGYTTFVDEDLSGVKGLEAVYHLGPSSIGIDTLYKSRGQIPEVFLRGCGVSDDLIAFIPSHFGSQQAIQFYSCFISYSTRDEEFARRLYSRMREEKLRVWFVPEDIKGGQKLYEQIERAIQLHDRLLLVLSESSMQSEWVMTEIQRARETEVKEGRRKLFPISIVEFDKVKTWRRFDADTGKDLAKEVREYFIPDFSNWKDHDAFEKAFERLLRDLRAEEARA